MNISYNDILTHCIENSRLSRIVIDNFLIAYAAEKNRLEYEAVLQINNYRNIAKEIDDGHMGFLMSEFIAHRIFKKEGLIKKYLNHSQIKNLPKEQYDYLSMQEKNPWRFSFAIITGNQAESFFEMEDVFTGEKYLLYSPGMKSILEATHPTMWFNLIAFNGQCWQTFGLIIPLLAFLPDDIFFLATEINSMISDEKSLLEEIEKKPWPFFMLINYSNIPMVVSKQDEL